MSIDDERLRLQRRLKEDPNDEVAKKKLHELRLRTEPDYAAKIKEIEDMVKAVNSLATLGPGSIGGGFRRQSGAIAPQIGRRHGA